MIGIELIMTDGTKDFIDPVDESQFDEMFKAATDIYDITNSYHTYFYQIDKVKEVIKYQLYPCCGFDARGDHYIRCENWKLDD